MKSFDSRTYSINDFLEWHSNEQLEYNPFFQRRPVWSPSAKSYLMDTIIRGKPIPKVFLRQKIDIGTRKSVREVVDGQQRLRTIIGFVNNEFAISRKHNSKFGGKKFSDLDSIEEGIQAQILNYEVSTDLLVNMSDSDVLDVFSRLNSYAVILNEQEKLNALYFGTFKTLASKIGQEYNEFWKANKILSPNSILRMSETTLTAEIIVFMLEGIQDKKSLKSFYSKYEEQFDYETEDIEHQFNDVMNVIQLIFGLKGLAGTEFERAHMFYTLFSVIFHLRYGIKGISESTEGINIENTGVIRQALEGIEFVLQTQEKRSLGKEDGKFYDDSSEATTVKAAREYRTIYMVKKIREAFNAINT